MGKPDRLLGSLNLVRSLIHRIGDGMHSLIARRGDRSGAVLSPPANVQSSSGRDGTARFNRGSVGVCPSETASTEYATNA